MNQSLNRCVVASLRRRCDSTIQRFGGLPVLLSVALFFHAAARAQMPQPGAMGTSSSVSGQFVVIGSNPATTSAHSRIAITDPEWVRLEPALLAVSAERVKKAIWRALGIDPASRWRGRIYLALHPAASSDEDVTIISTRVAGVWNYRVELPDVLFRTRLARAFTGAVLLELANRGNSSDHSAEIPAWLTEGLSQQLLAASGAEMILSPPDKAVNGLPVNRSITVERGMDAFADARPVLQKHPALDFEQLSWPDDAQLRGDDGGVYRVSAQLFVSKLLELNHGPEHLRAMLQMLPRCYNWQTAFRAAFAADFPQPVDLEKWWVLQTVSFAAGDDGPIWTFAASRSRLDEILSVPAEFRFASNSLPVHVVVSLQSVVHNFDSARQTAILQAKVRALGLVQWRMDPQCAVLAAAYREVLADYLGRGNDVAPAPRAARAAAQNPPSLLFNRSAADIVGKLDALDARRRTLANAIRPVTPAPKPR
jgi:hypothetical protein